ISRSLLEAIIHATKAEVSQPQPTEPLNSEGNLSLNQILDTLNRTQLKTLATYLDISVPPSPTMVGRFPALSTSDLPQASAEEQASTASPARGTAMLNSIFKSVRVPEFRHKWMFWAEKGQQSTSKDKPAQSEEYAARPKPLGDQIISVKEFYQHFNNIPVESLKLRDSIHLFHLGVKPVWEDPRNTRGGAWYFKIPKDIASQFWHEMCLLAVGDGLQGAVETKRASFNDDICGISYSVRWNAVQVAVWNRDGENEEGKKELLKTILEKLSEELRPKKEDSYWYKAHKEHKGFIDQ
ncbi:translation initiation factor eIF 4e-like domain-containing protein, partial [Phaeosphaeriaceae sp. PMI808]